MRYPFITLYRAWIVSGSMVLALFLTACAPSASAIETAIAKAQAAFTPTFTPTTTTTPTPTPTATPSATPSPTSTPTSLPTPIPVILYSEDFSNNQSGWTKTAQGDARFQYSGGQYVVSRGKGNYLNWANAKRNFTDAVITLDALHVSGDNTATGILVIWRYVDRNNYYALRLTADGYLAVEKLLRGDWISLYEWAFNSAIERGQKVNRIAVAFGGGTSTIYINGRFITRIGDSSFTSGDIALGAFSDKSSAVEVSFDNLIVYTIDSWTAPKQQP